MQRKIRLIKSKQKKASEAYGITIPPEIVNFYKDAYFTIERTGTGIILTSGTHNKQIDESLTLENFR